MASSLRITRRAFVSAAALLPFAGCETSEPSAGPSTANAYPKIIDSASRVTPYLQQLKAAGVNTVFRYYAAGAQAILPEKRLIASEAVAIRDAGMSIGLVYQYYNNVKENIHAARGSSDAQAALESAAAVGQPRGTAIYFGIDGDWSDIDANIKGYFSSVNEALAGTGYEVGAYGSGRTCELLRSAAGGPLAKYFWLAYPIGWSGAASFYNSGNWRLCQISLDTKLFGSLGIDTNMLDPAASGFGQWGPGQTSAATSAVYGARRWVTRKDAKLYVQADASSGIISTLSFRKGLAVRVLETSNGWARVDVNETGAAVGFVKLGDLSPTLATRPDYFAPDP